MNSIRRRHNMITKSYIILNVISLCKGTIIEFREKKSTACTYRNAHMTIDYRGHNIV